MRQAAAALIVFAVLLAGCGGADRAQPGDAAALAPANARALVEVDGDLDSEQWRAARQLVDRFPDGDRLVRLLEELDEAAGDRIVVVAASDEELVALTQPEDESRLRTLLDEHDLVFREVGGWTAMAKEAAALDRYEQALARGTLEGNVHYEAAREAWPDEALARAYVRGEGGFQWAALGLTAHDDGFRLAGRMRSDSPGADADARPVAAELLDEVPGDALAVIAFGGGEFLSRMPNLPGIDLAPVAGLLQGGGVVWVRIGVPVPEVTVLLPGADDADLDRLVHTFTGSEPEAAELDGRPAKRVRAGSVAITYAELDGRLVVTTAGSLTGGSGRLEDDPTFRDAREAAGMPDEVDGFLYVDVRRVAPLLGLAGVDDELARNLGALGSVLAFAAGDGADQQLELFVEIR